MQKPVVILMIILWLSACAPAPAPTAILLPTASTTLQPSATATPPTPTATPLPPLQDLPAGIILVRNSDNTWSIGIEAGDKTEAFAGTTCDSSGLHITLDGGEVIDIPADQIKNRLQISLNGSVQILDASRNGEVYAWYDPEEGLWRQRYETIFTLDGSAQKPDWAGWIKDGGGFQFEWPGDEEEIVEQYVVFSGRVSRVFTELIPHPQISGEYVKLIWMSVTYGNGDKTVDVLLFPEKKESTEDMLIVNDRFSYYGYFYIPPLLHTVRRRYWRRFGTVHAFKSRFPTINRKICLNM